MNLPETPTPRPRRRHPARLLLAALPVALALMALLPAASPAQTAGDATGGATSGAAGAPADAALLAQRFDLSEQEARSRLDLQREAGDLERELVRLYPGSFAGLYLSDPAEASTGSPDLTVRFAGPVPAGVAAELSALPGSHEILTAENALLKLREAQADAAALAERSGLDADTAIDLAQNRVEVLLEERPPETTPLVARAKDPRAPVAILTAPSPIEPAKAGGGPLAGGLTLKTRSGAYCTSGLAVRGPSGDPGLTTAAHCPARLHAPGGEKLRFVRQKLSGSSDAQWHLARGSEPRMRVGKGFRPVRGTIPRDAQPVGAFVCKFGSNTGRTCGTIAGKWYAPSYVPRARATFVGFADDRPVVKPGDSGGPVFTGDSALGTVTAFSREGKTYTGYYMPVDYLAELGLRVRTTS